MTQFSDHTQLATAVRGLQIGPARHYRGLTVAPLFRQTVVEPDWLLLDEALAGGSFQVTELNEGGVVPTLNAANMGKAPVLLLDGEELVGAKQNRILNTTILVGPGQTVPIPVSCVEQGRWAYRTHRFASEGRTLYASLRRKKAAQVHRSLASHEGRQADQHRIWTDLAEKHRTHGVASETEAMRDGFVRYETELGAYRSALAPVPQQVGALVYGGSDWWGLDLLTGPRLFRRAWPRLLSGYAMDALLAGRPGKPAESPADRLASLGPSRLSSYAGVGLGTEHRFRGAGLVGACLALDDTIAHLMAFPE